MGNPLSDPVGINSTSRQALSIFMFVHSVAPGRQENVCARHADGDDLAPAPAEEIKSENVELFHDDGDVSIGRILRLQDRNCTPAIPLSPAFQPKRAFRPIEASRAVVWYVRNTSSTTASTCTMSTSTRRRSHHCDPGLVEEGYIVSHQVEDF